MGTGQQPRPGRPGAGDWRIVLMKADGTPGVRVDVSVGARVPHLLTIAIAARGGGILLMLLTGGGLYLVRRWRA
jgi:hypothetical protein